MRPAGTHRPPVGGVRCQARLDSPRPQDTQRCPFLQGESRGHAGPERGLHEPPPSPAPGPLQEQGRNSLQPAPAPHVSPHRRCPVHVALGPSPRTMRKKLLIALIPQPERSRQPGRDPACRGEQPPAPEKQRPACLGAEAARAGRPGDPAMGNPTTSHTPGSAHRPQHCLLGHRSAKITDPAGQSSSRSSRAQDTGS